MEWEQIFPESYPTKLLSKDWSKRRLFWYAPATEFMAKLHEMEVREDDVWIDTLAKSGTTWTQELVWLIMNNFDFETAKRVHIEIRSPFLECDYYVYRNVGSCLRQVEELRSPRLIKSHLPLPLLPAQLWQKKSKLIYVCRNPIDALISKYYHDRSLGMSLDKSLVEYLIEFVEEGSQKILPFEHIAEFYALRNEPWVYYTSYERLKSKLSTVISDICEFLNISITETQMQQMLQHLSFDEMKKNPKTNLIWTFERVRTQFNISTYEPNNFVRKGKVNGYQEELPIDFAAVMERWVEENLAEHNLTLADVLLLNREEKC